MPVALCWQSMLDQRLSIAHYSFCPPLARLPNVLVPSDPSSPIGSHMSRKLVVQRCSHAVGGGSLSADVLPGTEDEIMLDGHPLASDTTLNAHRPKFVDPKCCYLLDGRSTGCSLSRSYLCPGPPTSITAQRAAADGPSRREHMYDTPIMHHAHSPRVITCAMQSRTTTMRLRKSAAILNRIWPQNLGSDTPVVGTTSQSPILPHIDTGPSVMKLLLPDKRSLSDMRLPPIEPMDPTIHMPSLLDAAEESRKLSEDVGEANETSMIPRIPSGSTHSRRTGVQHRADGVNDVGYCRSIGSRTSAINLFSSGGLHHEDGNANEVHGQSHGTELATNDVREYLPLDSSSLLDHPATSQPVEAEKERRGADFQSHFFQTEREEPNFMPEPAAGDNPPSPSSGLKTRETSLMFTFFWRRKHSQRAQESEQVSSEIVYTARDKRPLVVANRNRDARAQERSNVDTTLDRCDTTWTATSSSPSVADGGDAQGIDAEHHGCCYVCCFKVR